MLCNKCGTQNPDEGKFCFKCGNELNIPKSNLPSNRDKSNWKSNLMTTIGLVSCWILGGFFFLCGFVFLIDGLINNVIGEAIFVGVPCLIFSLIVIPPAAKWSEKKFNYRLSNGSRIGILLFLFILFAMLVPPEYLEENDLDTSQSVQSSTHVQSSSPIQTSIPTTITTATPTPILTHTPTPSPTPMPVPTIEKIKCTLEEFDSIFDDYSSLTELQKKDQFENNYKGKIITWDGYVERVYEGWTGDYCIWMRSSNTVEGNADLKSCFEGENNKDILLSLQDGDHVRIIGTIENYQDLYPSYYVEGMQLKNI
ncbi:MAG: hypothetical protein GQ469_00550 [Methanosarcinales archaeon]|nr:hypothetical protein [Methanosarcinales archaeon]